NLVETITDLLNADLLRNVTLELPETNKLIDFLSDPTKLATLGFGVVGALLAIVGAIVSFIAFKTKAPSGESNKKVIIVRVVFIGITLLGIVLLSGGVMLPVLTASGKLAILA
ncbi:MAG: hypothetical protein KAG04_01875, partial [Mycoplasmataceae bacterium]|nr:hypothetical protein [Mycoplasmataceae bacterium]